MLNMEGMDHKSKGTGLGVMLKWIYDFLSGFKLATLLILLLLALTWLSTLEQVDYGLYPTLNKYFHWKALWLIPEINEKKIWIVLPGGYYVCALLLVNMILGGIVRIRKGKRQIGNLISHFGIVFMLIGGGAAHHFSERGNMAIYEGETSDVAEDYMEYVIEVAEVKDGKSDLYHVIRGKHLTDLEGGNSRVFDFKGLPFSLKVSGYVNNAFPTSVLELAPQKGELVTDGYYLLKKKDEKASELNTAGAYAQVIFEDGEKSAPFILAARSFQPFTVRDGERVFTVDMRKKLWEMPFKIALDRFNAEFHPNSGRAKKFESYVRRIENGQEADVKIHMNEPMRYEGLTFFQANYGPQNAKPGDKMYTVFEVVRNPADKWPEYSLYVVILGMLVTFLTKLFGHIGAVTRKARNHG